MIACFKPKARENWKSLCITRSANEAYNHFLSLNGSFISVHDVDEEQFYQVFNTFRTEKDETEAPIYNQVLELEAIELHRLAKIVECKGGYVLDLNTDCVSAAFPKDNINH